MKESDDCGNTVISSTKTKCLSSQYTVCDITGTESRTLCWCGKALLPHPLEAYMVFPNCLDCALIILISDSPQSIPMTHCSGSLCLLPKQLWSFRACVYFTGQLTLNQYMIFLNKHYFGEHCNCNYCSSMAHCTVGQLWGTRGYKAMW